jgi:mRNA interferase MazF
LKKDPAHLEKIVTWQWSNPTRPLRIAYEDSTVCKRYDVYWGQARSRAREQAAQNAISRDVLNRALETVVVCPLTSRLHPDWRTRLPVKVAGKPSEIAADQIRAISKSRLGKKFGSLSAGNAAALRRLLGEMYANS